MMKETLRQNDGDVRSSNADVISAVRKMGLQRDEVFAVLTRNNKLFNKQGVRFAAGEGGVTTLNGEPVDLLQFGGAPRADRTVKLVALPPTPTASPAQVSHDNVAMGRLVDHLFTAENADVFARLCLSSNFRQFAFEILKVFNAQLQEWMLMLVRKLNDQLVGLQINLSLFELGAYLNVACYLLQVVFDFVHREISRREQGCRDGPGQSLTIRFAQHAETILRSIETDGSMLQKLVNYAVNCIAEMLNEHGEELERDGRRERSAGYRKTCTACGGYYVGNR